MGGGLMATKGFKITNKDLDTNQKIQSQKIINHSIEKALEEIRRQIKKYK